MFAYELLADCVVAELKQALITGWKEKGRDEEDENSGVEDERARLSLFLQCRL